MECNWVDSLTNQGMTFTQRGICLSRTMREIRSVCSVVII